MYYVYIFDPQESIYVKGYLINDIQSFDCTGDQHF